MIRVQIVNTIINTTTTNVNFWLGYSCILSAKSVYPATRTSSLSALYSGIVIFLTLLYSSQFRLQFPLGLEFEGCETVFGLSAGGAGIHSEPFQYQLPSSLNVMISPMNDSFQTFLRFDVTFYTRKARYQTCSTDWAGFWLSFVFRNPFSCVPVSSDVNTDFITANCALREEPNIACFPTIRT